ncbi:MAG: hypothetical protein H0Z31_06530 [Bacillus sp. (in: Bacteria)]|nr:hypothetical protein [Bacillus sp. (in: firmicutes)]
MNYTVIVVLVISVFICSLIDVWTTKIQKRAVIFFYKYLNIESTFNQEALFLQKILKPIGS